ncbi:uncharacterized protein, partial [Littorina saxatilis]|uniref:uncharacterized protein n=1 Tax=Littorina saxatilis TaxID=31220 RepID=UPI0038B56BAE
KRLNCWAGWEDGEFIFLVAADHNEPRYCLRFPKQQHGEFSVLVYFSVICPTENDGKPPPGIEYYELRMRRKDVLPCEDEHALHCEEIAEHNKCSRDHDFARHCPRSCGLCEDKTEAEKKDRCWFDPRLYGDWILYERERTEDVFIDRYSLSFSQLGDFTCTDVISENDYRYKTISTFKNGCSERYTCFEFKRRNNNVLQFRVGKSHRKDGEPETICHFDKDSSPLRDRYRSFEFKNLILARDLWPSYCGLNSNIPFNGTVNGEQCEGELGDWSPDTCTTRGTLVFRSSTCASLIIPQEFQCLAFIPADEGSLQQQLITRSMDGKNEYNCWVISSHIEGPRWPYRIMYRMPTTQCPESPETASGAGMLPKATLYLDDKSRSKVCYPDKDNPASTQGTSTRSTDLKYVIPDQNNGNKHVHIGSQRPQADGSSPTPASGLSQGAAQSCCPSWFLTCALSFVAALTMASLSNIGMMSKWVPSDVTSFSSRR